MGSRQAQETCSLKSTSGAFVWMPVPTLDGRLELVGYADSGWALVMLEARRASPLQNLFRWKSVIATSAGTVKFHAAAAVAAQLLHIKAVLEIFGLETHAKIRLDSSTAKCIAKCAIWKHVCCGFSQQFEGDRFGTKTLRVAV